MPDTFTTNPPHLRSALSGIGAKCGEESRVIKPRDPEWTCHVDSASWRGDVYIHDISEFYEHWFFLGPLVIALISGVFIGLLWGKGFWRR